MDQQREYAGALENKETNAASRQSFLLGDKLVLRTPIVQAALGSCDGPGLAAAVSRAGALGCLTVHATPAARLKRQIEAIQLRTPRPVLLAFTAPYEREDVLDTALAAGIRHFQVFWWNGPRLAPRIKASGATIFWQSGSADQASEALDMGADILIAQGTEAGGQVRSALSLRDLIPAVRAAAGAETPIVAGGGLATRDDIEQVLTLGANAALLGTRFLVSEEARCSRQFKARVARATTRDLILDARMVGDWPCAPRRRIRTAYAPDAPGLFAGRGIDHICEIKSAAKIVRDLTPR